MAETKHLIAPERLGLWVAATFVVALLALVVATISITRSSDLMYMTQAEVLLLNKKIEGSLSGHPSGSEARVSPAENAK